MRYNMTDKSDNTKVIRTGGISFCSLLTIVFIVLKLCNVITWSWFWVLSPLIFSFGLGIVLLIISLIILAIVNR